MIHDTKGKTMENFAPELCIFGLDDVSVVVFDTLSPFDKTRAARSVYLPKNIKQLSFKLNGFDANNTADLGDSRTITGDIILQADESDYELAKVTLVLPAISKVRKDGTFEFISIEDVEYNVRQAVSDALNFAMNKYFSHKSAPVANAPQMSYVASVPVGGQAQNSMSMSARFKGQAASNDEKKSYRRKMLIAIGAPLLLLFVLWAGSRLVKPVNPIEDAVAKAMRQDPSSVQAQVELTKQTLQQMGLDPGQSGDIGCLTPKR